MSKQGEKQGEKLSDIDKMLLGEVELSTARGITKVNKGGPYDPEHYSGYKCTMGVSIPVDSKGNAIKDEEGNLNNDGEVGDQALSRICLLLVLRRRSVISMLHLSQGLCLLEKNCLA